MMKTRIQTLLAGLIICGSAQAQNETQTNDLLTSFKEKAAIAVALSAMGGIAFYEDHLKPLQEGEYPDAGNARILWAAQYNNDKGFAEGRFQGGTVLGALQRCEAAKEHYENPQIYGPGACERIKKYASGHHFWESMRSGVKWYFFVLPVGVTTAIVASCTGICAYKKLKRH